MQRNGSIIENMLKSFACKFNCIGDFGMFLNWMVDRITTGPTSTSNNLRYLGSQRNPSQPGAAAQSGTARCLPTLEGIVLFRPL